MDSEKVKEIKKALGYCYHNSPCEECGYNHELGSGEIVCRSRLIGEVLTYINELESEISEVEIKNNIRLGLLNIKLLDEKKQLKDRIAELEKENDEQYKRIMELEQDLVHADENVFYRECDVALQENKIKTEALKQFAERLKIVCVNKIHETLKEFIKE